MNILYSFCGYCSTNNNNQFATRPQATKEEIKKLLPYAFSALAISDNNPSEWLEYPNGYLHIKPNSLALAKLPGKLEARESCFYDPETALKIAIYQSGSELLIAFGALNSSKTEVEASLLWTKKRVLLYAGAFNLLWGKPTVFRQAVEFVSLLKDMACFKHLEVVITGQSFGGGLASYTALKIACRAICFNALPLGGWIHTDVESDLKELADKNITQVTIEGDWLSDNTVVRCQCFPFHQVNLVGKRVFVPSAYPGNRMETHDYIVGSLLEEIGIDGSTRPAQLNIF